MVSEEKRLEKLLTPTTTTKTTPGHANSLRPLASSAPYEANTVAVEKQLEGTRVTRKDISLQVAPPSLKLVAGGKQCASKSTITPTKSCIANLYRRIKRRVGHSLKRNHCKGNLVPSIKQVTHKPCGTEGGLSGLRRVPRPLFEQHSSGGLRQHYSGCLYKQRWASEVGASVCPSVENPDLVCQETELSKLDSSQAS